MTNHISTGRMNDALDGLLPSSEFGELEKHLDACAACRNDFAKLSETIQALGALPRDAGAPEGAWEGIAGRLDSARREEAEEVAVYRLPTATPARARMSFTVPQAVAAAITVAIMSAGLMWAAIGDRGGERPVVVAAERGNQGVPGNPGAPGAPGGAAARAVSLEGSGYAEEVGRLEQILEQGRSVLAPETLVSIEVSLATIDAAMDEIDAALADDPSSHLLLKMLANHQRTRLGVLQRAAAAVQAQT